MAVAGGGMIAGIWAKDALANRSFTDIGDIFTVLHIWIYVLKCFNRGRHYVNNAGFD